MGLIPQNFIDDLVSRADIVEIINARVPLKKKGREYSACCPFHSEKTPSFTVSEVKQFYHCFGCGAHGTVLGFLMQYENLDFVDAVEALAAEYNLDVPRENTAGTQRSDDRRPLYDMLEQVARLYQDSLKKSEKSIGYLKNRGLTGDIARAYRLGYAPEGWNFLTDKFNNSGDRKKLYDTGLLIKKDNGEYYDRFRDRIMFPITDRRGRVIGFGGRIIDQGEPKYLNSPENKIFHKGLELYGLYEARQTTRQLERIIVVEGYMDVVALAQHNITYAVASLGTATTQEQIQKILRTVPEIIFCYDGDRAGRQAAWRALENTLPVIRDGMIAKFLFLPDGEDPDSMVRSEGRDAFESRLEQATPLSDFLFDTLKEKADVSSDDGKARLNELARPLITRMTDGVLKDLLIAKLSKIIGVSEQQLNKRITGASSEKQATSQYVQRSRQISGQSTIRKAIALLLQHPSLAEQHPIPDDFAQTDMKGFPLLYQLHHDIVANNGITTTALLERYRDREQGAILLKLMEIEIPGTNNEQDKINLFKDYINHLKTELRESHYIARKTELENKFYSGTMTPEEKQEYNQLLIKPRINQAVDSQT